MCKKLQKAGQRDLSYVLFKQAEIRDLRRDRVKLKVWPVNSCISSRQIVEGGGPGHISRPGVIGFRWRLEYRTCSPVIRPTERRPFGMKSAVDSAEPNEMLSMPSDSQVQRGLLGGKGISQQ
jgi:hypothetical protein